MSDRLQSCQLHVSRRVLDAMRALDLSGVKVAFVVDESGRVLGTIADGDVRRALLGGATLDSPVEPLIQRDFVWVDRAASRANVLELMQARSVAQIPVLDDDGRLIGLHLMNEMLRSFERPTWAVIMAGGQGMRLRPVTNHIPKAMLPVAGRPILERLVLHLVGYGIRRVFLAVNYLAEMIEAHFGDGEAHGCRIEYLRETLPLGTGGALSLLPAIPTAPLLVLNGDLVTQLDVDGLLAFHEDGGFRATVAVHEYSHTVPFGVVDTDGDRLVGLREKPTMSWRTNAGIYVLDPVLAARVPPQTEYSMPSVLEDCLQRREPVGVFPIEGDWIDVGRSKELQRARGEAER